MKLKIFNQLSKFYLGLDKDRQSSFLDAIYSLVEWKVGKHRGLMSDNMEMRVQTAARANHDHKFKVTNKAKQIELAGNFAAWFTRNIAPQTIPSKVTAYRLHRSDKEFKKDRILVRPFRSMLSWTDQSTPYLYKGTKEAKETMVVLKAEFTKPQILWTPETSLLVREETFDGTDFMITRDKFKKKYPDSYLVAEALGVLHTCCRFYQNEREIIVFSKEPFEATVMKRDIEASIAQ